MITAEFSLVISQSVCACSTFSSASDAPVRLSYVAQTSDFGHSVICPVSVADMVVSCSFLRYVPTVFRHLGTGLPIGPIAGDGKPHDWWQEDDRPGGSSTLPVLLRWVKHHNGVLKVYWRLGFHGC